MFGHKLLYHSLYLNGGCAGHITEICLEDKNLEKQIHEKIF